MVDEEIFVQNYWVMFYKQDIDRVMASSEEQVREEVIYLVEVFIKQNYRVVASSEEQVRGEVIYLVEEVFFNQNYRVVYYKQDINRVNMFYK